MRRRRSHQRAVEAILDLIEEGYAPPTAQQIAERAGISIRTVFRLTEDVDSLHAAAVARQSARVAPLYVRLPTQGPLAERLSALVRNRVTIFETISPVRRVAERLALTSEVIAAELARNQQLLRSQVESVLGRELALASRGVREELLDCADLAVSWQTWDQLRRVRGLSRSAAERVVRRLLEAVFAETPPVPSAHPDAADTRKDRANGRDTHP